MVIPVYLTSLPGDININPPPKALSLREKHPGLLQYCRLPPAGRGKGKTKKYKTTEYSTTH